MTRPNITPGEWHLGKRAGAEYGAIYGSKGEEIALPLGFFMEDDEAKANARAIAAVPVLLEALESFVNTCEHGNPMQFIQKIGADCTKAKAALALAGYTFP